MLAEEQLRADVAEAREVWREAQPALDPDRLVFIDETGCATNMARLRGRGPKGARVRGRTPHGHWKITTFVAGPASRRADGAHGDGRADERGRVPGL